MRPKTTTIVVADDHNIIRQALCALLAAQPGFDVVGEARDGIEAVAEAERLRPDVLVLDMVMPNLNGIEVTRRLRERLPKCAVVILSMYGADGYVQEAIQGGARGYVLKKDSVEELTTAINEVVVGGRYISPSLIKRVVDSYLGTGGMQSDRYQTLTARERQILHMVAAGSTSAQVSTKLSISRRTVEFHRANIMRKLGLRTQQALARYCIESGITPRNG
jgi:two-component system response regulator NreC